MKKTLILVSLVTLSLAGCDKIKSAGGDKSDSQKYSYALGQQFGKNIKNLGVPLDKSALVSGLRNAIDGKEDKMDDKQIQEAMMMLKDARMAEIKGSSEKSQKETDKFFEENKTKEGVKTTASGLQYKVITEGTGEKPSETDIVKVHYTGTLVNGTKFDSSVDRNEPAMFPVNGVIPGWTEALMMMPKGSKWQLFIPGNLAYGMNPPQGSNIPANATLIFDVELLDVQKAPTQEHSADDGHGHEKPAAKKAAPKKK